MRLADETGYRQKIYDLVRKIPRGRVMTYGQIAEILGEGYTARTVGYVMHGADAENVPWQRVINAQGKCSTGKITLPVDLQQSILESEGIAFSPSGKCDLNRVLWSPPSMAAKRGDSINLFERGRSETGK